MSYQGDGYDEAGSYAHLAGGRRRQAPREGATPVGDGYRYDEGTDAAYGHAADHPDDGYVDEHGQWVYHDDGPADYADEGYVEDDSAGGGYAEDGSIDAGYDDGDGYGRGGYGGGAGVRAHARRRPPKRRHPVRTVILSLFVILVLIVVGLGVHLEREINPGGHPGQVVTVTIPAGASSAQIGTVLSQAGVIHGSSLFRYYVKLKGSGPLLPGTYQLARNEKYDQVISALNAGPPLVDEKLVIPEGFTMAQIAARVGALPKLGLSGAKFSAAATTGQVRSPYEPAGVNDLEGLVFPATYTIRQGMTETDVLQALVDRFDQEATSLNLAQAAATLGMTPYQVVTVASIVEREAKLDQDRANVASAIYNRLKKGMTLGADSTLVYALRKANPSLSITSIDYNQPNPYNTRLNKGLPPTPIANAGIPSLTAATSPASTTYLYFVEINPDGQLGFASTSSGFSQLEVQCRAVNLC